jgi:tetratricopeptide (TPR) repeat protein
MKNYKNTKNVLMAMCLVLVTLAASAQNLTTPRPSQFASVTQRVGISDVTIAYHSPGVRGRAIWGAQVPYGNVWRAGANENTTITLSHDAQIEGQQVKAGTYGLFMLPIDEGNFKILLSKYAQSWGTVSPSEDELVAQATVKTAAISPQEWLSYDFTNRTGNDVTAVLRWDKLEVPFKIAFDVNKIVIDNARAELKGPVGFSWRGYSNAASYCLLNDTNLEEAMTWIEQSLAIQSGFTNLQVKAGLLAKQGKQEASDEIMKEAVPTANAFQLNQYGYQLLGAEKTKEAIEIFSLNVEKNANHQFIWGFTDSLGEAYLKDGNKKMALKQYKQARKLAPENQWAYLDGVIKNIDAN